MGKKLRLGLDIGCGESRISMEDTRFLRCDIRPATTPDVLCNVTLLPFADASFDVVHSSHVLEHFPRKVWKLVLGEWLRLLKVGGQAWFRLPNIAWAADRISKDGYVDEHVLNVLYGAQDNPFDFHYHGMTPEIVMNAMKDFGFTPIHFSEINYNMILGFCRAEPY